MIESSDTQKELKRKLKKTNSYKQLVELIQSIVLTETRLDYNFMKKSLPVFKRLLNEAIDNAWSSARSIVESSLPQPLKHIRHVTSVPKLRNANNSENQLAWSSETIHQNSKIKEDKIFTAGSYIKGPASFAKSIREMNRKRQPSPGPGCYYFESLKNKIRSPRIVFPKSAVDRTSYIPSSLSPGPSKYYPSMNHALKYS